MEIPASVASEAARAMELPQAAPAQSAPSWRERHWFPVASVLELDPERATPVRIDGIDLLVQQTEAAAGDGEDDGVWSVRAAQCQQQDQLPTVVFFKMVWVWFGKEAPVGHPKDLFEGTYLAEREVFFTYTRDLPYGYDSLLENLVDVSHIPFAHHGLQGTRDDAAPVGMSVPQVVYSEPGKEAAPLQDDIGGDKTEGDGRDYISFDFKDRSMKMFREASFFLRSPFFFYYKGTFEPPPGEEGSEDYKKFAARRGIEDGKDKVPFLLNVTCIPIEPGWSRAIIVNTKKPDAPGDFISKLPKFASHIFSNRFLDSDLAFLHYQERWLRRQQPTTGSEWQQAYYIPGECDRSVSAFRQWLLREGARCVLPGHGSQLPPTPASRAELLDRWNQHSAHCVHCQQAMSTTEMAQKVFGALGAGAFALDRLELGPTPLWLFLQILAVGVAIGGEKLKELLTFVDYEHYKS